MPDHVNTPSLPSATAAEALVAGALVRLTSSGWVYCDAGEIPQGVTEVAYASGDYCQPRSLQAGSCSAIASGAVTAGARLYTAADGKVSMTPSSHEVGLAYAAANTTEYCHFIPCGSLPPSWQDRTVAAVADNLTLDAQDVGKVMLVTVDAKTITLPATAAGLEYVIVNGGADAGVLVTVSPNANDKIMGADLAGVDNKDRLNTKATAKRGDYIHIRADGVDGWFVVAQRGTWAAEA